MLFNSTDNLFFAVTLLHGEISFCPSLMEISSTLWHCFWGIGQYHNLCAEKNLIQIYWSIATPAQQGSANGKIGSLIDERKNKSLYRELKFVLKKFFRSQADKLR